MNRRTLRMAAGAAALALGLTACGGSSSSSDTPEVSVAQSPQFEAGTTMATLSQAGTVKVGIKFDQPGFGLRGLSGDYEGFDVEIAKIIAGGLGISPDKIQFSEATSAVREQVIENGQVDMVVATYTINDKRKQRISFAGPYYTAGQQIMVKSDNSAITGPDSLKSNPDQKVCSVTGSTPSEQIKPYLADPSQLVLFDQYSQCADALGNGQVQAVTTDNVILLGFVSKSNGDYKLVGQQFTDEPYGIGIKKGDTAFCGFINEQLTKASQDGTYTKAWESTAGTVEGAQTPTLPALDTCS
ncbi:glutamate ABC transporter substrate-binding protein [Rhodococcus aerolatus]